MLSCTSPDAQAATMMGVINRFINENRGLNRVSAEDLDRQLKGILTEFTKGMSPLELMNAYSDWLGHLAISPGRSTLLLQSFMQKAANLGVYNLQSMCGAEVDPLVKPNRRFQDEAWKGWPFNVLSQSWQLAGEWWAEAASGVDGVSKSNEMLVGFMAEQILEQLSPANFFATNPEVLRATKEEKGQNIQRGMANLVGDKKRELRGDAQPGTESFIPGQQVAVTPGKVVFQNELVELMQYEPSTEKVGAEPVLIVPAWIMKYYILDLSPHNSMVKYLRDQGKTVFVISWKNPDEGDRDMGMDDYLKKGVMASIDAISAIVGERKIHAAGYCIGGTLLSIAAALMARENDDRLKSVTLMAAQTDFTEAGEIRTFLGESIVSFLNALMHKQGHLGSDNMGGAFASMRAGDLIYGPSVDRYLLGKDAQMNDLMAWNADGTRMPYKMHSEYLRRCFLENDLAEARFSVDGRPVCLSDIKVPLFVVGTVTDHVAPWKSVYKINRLCFGDISFLLTSGGHNAGIVSGPSHPRRSYQLHTRKQGDNYIDPDTWAETIEKHQGSWWPVWDRWLDEHISGQVAPPKMGAPRKGYKVLRDAPGEYVFG